MFKGIYVKLAVSNLKKNRKSYIPYMITSILTVMMFYDIYMIAINTGIDDMPGDDSVRSVLGFGTVIVAIFACIFLFYTNNFLMKQRKKEIGLYNVLGMGKRNIAVMMLWESLFIGAGSIILGVLFGILMGKLIFLILYRILGYGTSFQYEISIQGITVTVLLFGTIFFVTLLFNLLQIRHTNPIELLHGGNVGEREPKTKVFMTILGLIMLVAGYVIANKVENPVTAITIFFIAVLLVVLGTYALFVAGSIFVLKLLRKNKKFYYHQRHFHSVSGMIYRMKQNAVGLANICILSTMVLVTVSTTVSLNMGMENIMGNRFPKEYMLTSYDGTDDAIRKIDNIVTEEINRYGLTRENAFRCQYVDVTAQKKDGKFIPESLGASFYPDKAIVEVAPVSYYNEMNGENVKLEDGEAVLFTVSEENYGKEELTLGDQTYRIKKETDTLAMAEKEAFPYMDQYYLFVKDESILNELIKKYGKGSTPSYVYGFDLEGSKGNKTAAANAIQTRLTNESKISAAGELRDDFEKDFHSLYGSFLFLGLFLGSLFLMATVLIIYYKQISEGYEDQRRYQIMAKVGMSKKEIKKSINGQVRLVFFIPLCFAVIHVIAAFRLMDKILILMNLTNTNLFIACTAGTVLAFAVIYIVVFKITAREYYKIVTK
ncbi:hypothetical protein B5F37_10245 [Drancourtella sp. An210]|nr:hypothetical protein B5F37_10245 [Drancourtella sp. An210]